MPCEDSSTSTKIKLVFKDFLGRKKKKKKGIKNIREMELGEGVGCRVNILFCVGEGGNPKWVVGKWGSTLLCTASIKVLGGLFISNKYTQLRVGGKKGRG